MSYKEDLNTIEWNIRRAMVLERDGYKCTKCPSTAYPQVHHNKYKKGYKAWEYPMWVYDTLCYECHREFHAKNSDASMWLDTGSIRKDIIPKAIVKAIRERFQFKPVKGAIFIPLDEK